MSELNVLMLSLSPFSYRANQNGMDKQIYYYKDTKGEQKEVKGTYQLDPVPQMLYDQNVRFDKVIILATDEVRKKKKLVAEDYLDSDDPISPLEYFKMHLTNLWKVDSENIKDIDIDENNPSSAIRETFEFLTCLAKDYKIKLFIDAHGGFRAIQLLLAALSSLLEDKRFNVITYTVQYNPNPDQKNDNTIVVDETMQIFDFISGINEFSNYGRIDSLMKSIDYDNNKDLLDPIIEISEGIQWCNISIFKMGLRDLNEYYNEKSKKSISDDYLKLFEERIRVDYGELLSDISGNNDCNDMDIAKWCMKKGFYQQALTILESNTWKYLYEKGVLAYTDDTQESNRKEVFDGCMYSFEPKITCWDENWETKDKGKFNKCFENNNKSEIFKKLDNVLVGTYGAYFAVGASGYGELLNTSLDSNMGNGQIVNNAILWNVTTEEEKRSLVILLFLYKTIKDIRNKINHVVIPNPYDQSAVKNLLNYYIGWAKKNYK